jgi:hypothetical protein
MKPLSSRVRAAALPLLLACGAFVSPVLAQQPQQQPRTERRPAVAATSTQMDAEATRRALMEILQKHPPAVGRVLKLDPSLMHSETYLVAYPELREFLAEHSEIPQNADFYFEGVRVSSNADYRPPNDRLQLVAGVLAGLAGLTAASIFLGTLIWLIRTALDQRRWSRLSKIQAEVHTKLMDRFSSNDELLTYVQTPSGRRFLESGPSPLQETGPAMGAPISRILWSLQLGVVLLVAGIGLLFLSGRAIPEAQEFFYVAGCMATAIGAGFLVSSAAAYGLSRRLGLLDRPSGPAQNNA